MKLSEIIWLDEIDSTNRFALDSFDCFQSGTLIAAQYQSAGRGSKGRIWVSPRDVNVYASLILKGFDFEPHQAAWIASLAVLEVLRMRSPRLDLSVKWPNDVLCDGKKIAGVLCDARKGAGIVIGIGVNINMNEAMFVGIGRPATSLLLESGSYSHDVGAITVELGKRALDFYALACADGIEELHKLWLAENRMIGKKVAFEESSGRIFQGVLLDCSADGSVVLLDSEDSQIRTWSTGELLLSAPD